MKYSFVARAAPILLIIPTLVQAVCPVITAPHQEAPCEENVDSPEIPVTPLPTGRSMMNVLPLFITAGSFSHQHTA